MPSVTLNNLLEARPLGLEDSEIWAILCQSVQALQDLFLSDGVSSRHSIPVITPNALKLTSNGRVNFAPTSDTANFSPHYLAPEFKLNDNYSDSECEKMWIYSLGETLKRCVTNENGNSVLCGVLTSMTCRRVIYRASLMHLLEIMNDYCNKREENRPFSHVVMDLHQEALAITDHPCFEESYRVKAVSKSKGLKVKRAASRLYGVEHNFSSNKCVGPEFVVKSSLPVKKLALPHKGAKEEVLIILLDGQKVLVACKLNTVTAGELLQVILEDERLEENFMLGLSALIAGDFVFLPPETRISKMDTLYLRIRLFLPTLRGIRSVPAKHLMYLQLRRSILEHQLPSSFSQIVELSSLALQAEFGDSEGENYFLLEHYVPETMINFTDNQPKLMEELVQAHKSKRGMNKTRAEHDFITLAQSLPYYGGHFYTAVWPVKDMESKEVWLYIHPEGLKLFERTKSALCHFGPQLHDCFEWKNIQTICYSKRYLCLVSHKENRKLKLKMECKKSYFAFRLASLHHQFFLRLRREYITLASLGEEFGVPLKEMKNETNLLLSEEKQNKENKRRGVKMGTKAFESQRSLDSLSFDAGEAFVLDSTFSPLLPNFQETINDSFLERLNNISFAEERVMHCVTLLRDSRGSLGLQVTEGSDGNVYVQSILPGGPFHLIFPGDQVIAVNGLSLLGRKYSESLELLKESREKMELILSRAVKKVRSSIEEKHTVESCCEVNSAKYKDRAIVVEMIPKKVGLESESLKKKATVALPRSLGLSRKWYGPVRYPVTPIKKVNCDIVEIYGTSDEEQVFI
ncbi:hypothetical protein ABEB36_007095 [Hypothenemus hampei]|uniref:Uncharacterized protein n=1 Tax=Hypothenemus hampei TaxID=57062 RepID=A0ABD1ETB0_HYPHA